MKQAEVTTSKLLYDIPESVKELFNGTVYPWETLDNIGEFIDKIYEELLAGGYKEHSRGVLIGEGTVVADTAVIEPPAIIGPKCEIRHCAYIRGNVITGKECVIGNSTEVKNSLLFDNVQIPHFNYVGDSILGNRSHMGAGSICSNVRQDKSDIVVKTDPPINTNRRKFGAIICDDVEIGCGSVINPGSVICKSTRVYPLASVRGAIKENMIVKKSGDIVPVK